MKLLGTPSDRDLHAMRATCSGDDLPKLKAYPLERMFPAHTSADAVDLAQRLLRYDPDQRLTASQVCWPSASLERLATTHAPHHCCCLHRRRRWRIRFSMVLRA